MTFRHDPARAAPGHPRALARAFANALEHLRDTWDVQYVPAGAVRGPTGGTQRTEAAPTASPDADPCAAPSKPAQAPPAQAPPVDTKVAMRERAKTWSAATKLEYLRRKNVGDCRRCGLCRSRTNIVFGVGNPEADLMFVGEAPGADEDRQGEPFVGRAGQRLDVWIRDLGLRREDVYIANVLKCRPPGNRDPKAEEVDKCSPFLKAQIRAIRPKAIVALGRHAGMLLSRREDLSLRAMRQSRLVYDAASPGDEDSAAHRIPLVVTYHPAYVLRQEGNQQRNQTSVTDTVMQDLRRALAIARDDA